MVADGWVEKETETGYDILGSDDEANIQKAYSTSICSQNTVNHSFGVSLTFLLIYILNPDKEPLPWRGYCTIPSFTELPPPSSLPPTASFPYFPPKNFTPPSFPPDDFETLSPAGVFLGIFSIDTGIERRMSIRLTYASHARSREGAGKGDGGLGTSRTIIRFILGQPRKDWERRIQLEIDKYHDIIILPVSENMNGGKSHAFFTWASSNAWVPPLYSTNFSSIPEGLTYTNATSPPPALAMHDPVFAHRDKESSNPMPWVHPDFVLKADDDAFVMLAELEAHLRVALHAQPAPHAVKDLPVQTLSDRDIQNDTLIFHTPLDSTSSDDSHTATNSPNTLISSPPSDPSPLQNNDPLIYWGYLVKNRFMAGELYGLSYSLVNWIAKDPQIKGLTRGAEDKQTSKWMRLHPRASEVRWVSERCWIYDHPRAGTVYSHGFLFPSEVKRVQRDVLFDLEHNASQESTTLDKSSSISAFSPFGPYGASPPTWSRSTVSTFGIRYSLPISDLTTDQSIEALVEGSEMSRLREGTSSPGTIDHAWRHREGKLKRYNGRRLGGTIAVHFIKKNMWFLEAALALLEGEDITEVERSHAEEDSQLHRKAVLLESHPRTRLLDDVIVEGS
ncbi:unnamed protein product [Somion occarium]|uniref:Glycosyltransferase family 31 protein n=1 Tax=Somion occarium TaxID=3059160 RepID=A0ABP1CM43_9APHY